MPRGRNHQLGHIVSRARYAARVYHCLGNVEPSAVSEKVVPLLAPLLSKEGLGEVLWCRATPSVPPWQGEKKSGSTFLETALAEVECHNIAHITYVKNLADNSGRRS